VFLIALLFTLPILTASLTRSGTAISYFLAEVAGLSGIMSLFFCGICLAHYNFYNITVESQDASLLMFKSLAQLCETFVFAFLGITTGISISSQSNLQWHAGLIFLTLV
jgi:NhaP-type Na+/H+ or K+/H+ antiporter